MYVTVTNIKHNINVYFIRAPLNMYLIILFFIFFVTTTKHFICDYLKCKNIKVNEIKPSDRWTSRQTDGRTKSGGLVTLFFTFWNPSKLDRTGLIIYPLLFDIVVSIYTKPTSTINCQLDLVRRHSFPHNLANTGYSTRVTVFIMRLHVCTVIN